MSWLSSVAGKMQSVVKANLGGTKRLLGKAGGAIGGTVGGIVAGPAGAKLGATIGSNAASGLIPKSVNIPNPLRPMPLLPTAPKPPQLPALPNMPKQAAPTKPQPVQSPIQSGYNWIDQRLGGILPGGVLPTAFQPKFHGPGGGMGGGVLTGEIPMVTNPQQVQVARAPRGYVHVTMPDGTQKAVLKEVAYALGLRKRPQKRGGVSSRDVRVARRVQKFVTDLTVARQPRTRIAKKRSR